MESLATVVGESQTADGEPLLHPDDIVATDSHTPMINAIGVLGWGVGGLEGQAAMLGEPVPISFPDVVGIRLSNELRPGVTATDLALRITHGGGSFPVADTFVCPQKSVSKASQAFVPLSTCGQCSMQRADS